MPIIFDRITISFSTPRRLRQVHEFAYDHILTRMTHGSRKCLISMLTCAIGSFPLQPLLQISFLLQQICLQNQLLLLGLGLALLQEFLGDILRLICDFPNFFFSLFLPEGQVALLALLQDLNDGWPLQKVLHFTLVVHIPLFIPTLIVVLDCILDWRLLTV